MPRPRQYDYGILARRYHETDLSYVAVGREFGVSAVAVRHAVKEHGIIRSNKCRCGVEILGHPRRRYCDQCRIKETRAIRRRHYDQNREECLAQSADWYRANLSRFQATNRRWHAEHRRESNAAIARWKVRNRHKLVQYASTRRAHLLGQFIEDVDSQVVYAMHGGMCGICKEYVDPTEFEVDHVVPLSRGGAHGYVNVQPAHRSCNRKKGSKLEEERYE